MHKYELDRLIARHLVKLFGQNPFWVMTGMMLTTAFLSMWMSNTTSIFAFWTGCRWRSPWRWFCSQ